MCQKRRSPLFIDCYNFAIVNYRDKPSAAAARFALEGISLSFDQRLHAESLAVRYAAGCANGEQDDGCEFDEFDHDPPKDPESDEMDHDAHDGS